MLKWIGYAAVGVAVALSILLAVNAFAATGTPTAPTATITPVLNPSSAQVVTVTFQTQVYALQPPGVSNQQQPKVSYSVWQGTTAGKATLLYNNSSANLAVVSSTPTGLLGGLYTLTASVTLSLPSLCATTGCVGYYENLTINAAVQVPSLFGLASSPSSHIVFSNNPQYSGTVQTAPAASPNSWYWEFYGSIIAIIALVSTGLAIIVRHVALPVAAAIAWVALGVTYFIWIVI